MDQQRRVAITSLGPGGAESGGVAKVHGSCADRRDGRDDGEIGY